MAKKEVQRYIQNWLNGDERYYKHIFEYYYPKLFPAALRSVKQREENEELVMNVFLSIWQHKEHIRKADDFDNYVFAMLRNQVVNFQRKKVIQLVDIGKVPEEQLGFERHPELSLKELQRLYMEAVERLPEKQREVFLLSREQGLSQKEIAEQQQITINTVNNHIKGAIKTIRRELGDYSEAMPLLILLASYHLFR